MKAALSVVFQGSSTVPQRSSPTAAAVRVVPWYHWIGGRELVQEVASGNKVLRWLQRAQLIETLLPCRCVPPRLSRNRNQAALAPFGPASLSCPHVIMCFGLAQDAKEAKQESGQEVTAGSGGSYNTKGSGLVNGTKSSGAPRSTHSRAYDFQCQLSRSPQVVGGIRPPRSEPPCPCRSSASATTARPTASRTRATRKGSGSGAIAGCRSPDSHPSRAPSRGVFLGVISQ